MYLCPLLDFILPRNCTQTTDYMRHNELIELFKMHIHMNFRTFTCLDMGPSTVKLDKNTVVRWA